MKQLVAFLTVLAAIKFGYQEYLFRSATNELIISTYRDSAIEACRRDSKAQNLTATPNAWAAPASVKLVIGKPNLDVYFWQIDHTMWKARYTNPYLVLVAREAPNFVLCEYDIMHAAASLYRM
jgi:hypothetical protein